VKRHVPDHFCEIYRSTGTVDESFYQTVKGKVGLYSVKTGNKTRCPGCDGSGVSEKAKRQRRLDGVE
jgi:hypothetical protein